MIRFKILGALYFLGSVSIIVIVAFLVVAAIHFILKFW